MSHIIVSPSNTCTVQDVADSSRRDMHNLIGEDHPAFIDWVARAHDEVLRASRWEFLLSAPYRFVTEEGQTDYWIGASGSAPYGVVDTGLNLTNVDRIRDDSVRDLSRFRALKRVETPPLATSLANQVGEWRTGAPAVFRHDRQENAGILNIYPPPKSENTSPQRPPTPIATATAGGALSARTYFVMVSLVDSASGESLASSQAARVFVPASSLLRVDSPHPLVTSLQAGVQVTHYNVYVSTTEGSETKQNTSLVLIGDAWTEPAGGLIAGAALPSTPTLEPIRGHIIEFRFYQERSTLDAFADNLQVPCIYKDILVAGTNAWASDYLRRSGLADGMEAAYWRSLFERGIREIRIDINLHPKGADFMRPDPTSGTSSAAWPGSGWNQDSWPSI